MSDTKQEPPIIPFQFTCPMSKLRAMTLFASEDETRYVLNSVKVEITGRQVLLIATNGRALAVLKLDDLPLIDAPVTTSCILPSEFIKRAYQVFKAEYIQVIDGDENSYPETEVHEQDPAVAVELNANGTLSIAGPDYTLQGSPIIGKFPDWKRVFPDTPVGGGAGRANLNPDFLDLFNKAARILVPRHKQSCLVIRTHKSSVGDDTPVTIRISETEFVGLLMPMKSKSIGDGMTTLPEWLNLPKA